MKTSLVVATMFAVAVTVSGCTVAGSSTEPDSSIPLASEPTSTPTTSSSDIATGSIIDGFKLGVRVTCSPGVGPPPSGGWCRGLDAAMALAALDARDPGHAAVVSGPLMFTDGTQPEPMDVTGNAPTPTPAPTSHPGPDVTVFVFELADGSTRATGVACPTDRKAGAIVAIAGPCVGVGAYP
jgi:hypothetical protein